MTRSEIAEGLFDLMNKPPERKQEVVYALVQVRKLLEHDGNRDEASLLRFYCDWAFHTKLDRRGAAYILRILDERLGQYRRWSPENIDPDGRVGQVLSFDLFNRGLSDFLRRNDLPTVWTKDWFAWQKTIMFYGEQVRHTPLIMTRKGYKFRYLQKLVIAACEPSREIVEANPNEAHFGFKWQFTLNVMATPSAYHRHRTWPCRRPDGKHWACARNSSSYDSPRGSFAEVRSSTRPFRPTTISLSQVFHHFVHQLGWTDSGPSARSANLGYIRACDPRASRSSCFPSPVIRDVRVQESLKRSRDLQLVASPFEQDFAHVPERAPLLGSDLLQIAAEFLPDAERQRCLPLAHRSVPPTEILAEDYIVARTPVHELDSLGLNPWRELQGEMGTVHELDSDTEPAVLEAVVDPVHAPAPHLFVSSAEPGEPVPSGRPLCGHRVDPCAARGSVNGCG